MTERRAVMRPKTFIQGRIHFNHRRSTMDCVVREFTRDGGRLEFSDSVALPDTFEVYIPNKDQYFQAKTVWRRGNSIGIRWMREESLHPLSDSHQASDSLAGRVAKLEQEVASLRKRLNAQQS